MSAILRNRYRGRTARAHLRAATLLAMLGLATTRGAVAQGTPDEATGEPDPEMAEAPFQFRISATGGAYVWGAADSVPEIDDLAVFGLDIESRINPIIAFRLGGTFGRTTASDTTGSADVSQWTVDLLLVGRAAARPLVRAGVVPFAVVGVGSVILDPDALGLDPGEEPRTRNQGTFSFGAGLELGGRSRIGGRVEWRHYRVSLEDAFDPLERAGETTSNNMILASLFWKL